MEIVDFIEEGYLILVVVLYILGEIIKRTTLISDKYIPVFLMIAGIAGAMFISNEIAIAIFQGILCTGVAVLGNQTLKQLRKDE